MNFIKKYFNYIVSTIFILSIIFYILGINLKESIFFIFFFILMIIGLLFLGVKSWYEVYDIYKNYIYIPKAEKKEIKLKRRSDVEFNEEYKYNKNFNRKFYKNRLYKNLVLGIFSLILLIFTIINIF